MYKEREMKRTPRYLFVLAKIIEDDWSSIGKGVNFAARPYLDAMKTLEEIDEVYGADTARSVVAYFLSNATSWRGSVAREIKAELRELLKLKL